MSKAILKAMAAGALAAGLSAWQPADAAELYLGVEGALLSHHGDDFEGIGPAGLPSVAAIPGSQNVELDDGWGGRLWADVLLRPNLMLRGSVNGAWLDNDAFHENPSASLAQEQRIELDAFWATLEALYIWQFGRPLRPHTRVGLGGGIEYADVENRFEESSMFRGSPSARSRQDSAFWGVGPRVSGILDHELGQSGVHFFGEAGVAYLFGDRDDELDQQLFGSSTHLTSSDGGDVAHFGTRLGVGYVVPLGGAMARVDVGWRHDHFTNVNNVLFLPEDKSGDSAFSGPFVAVGFELPL